MNKKQITILKKICDNNGIEFKNIKFKQYRNLSEFKYFKLEPINPTHIIKLKGCLKNKHIYDNQKNKIINVGELILFISITLFIKDYYIILFLINSFLLTLYFISICIFDNPLEVVKYYFNWYRRRFRNRENINCS